MLLCVCVGGLDKTRESTRTEGEKLPLLSFSLSPSTALSAPSPLPRPLHFFSTLSSAPHSVLTSGASPCLNQFVSLCWYWCVCLCAHACCVCWCVLECVCVGTLSTSSPFPPCHTSSPCPQLLRSLFLKKIQTLSSPRHEFLMFTRPFTTVVMACLFFRVCVIPDHKKVRRSLRTKKKSRLKLALVGSPCWPTGRRHIHLHHSGHAHTS